MWRMTTHVHLKVSLCYSLSLTDSFWKWLLTFSERDDILGLRLEVINVVGNWSPRTRDNFSAFLLSIIYSCFDSMFLTKYSFKLVFPYTLLISFTWTFFRFSFNQIAIRVLLSCMSLSSEIRAIEFRSSSLIKKTGLLICSGNFQWYLWIIHVHYDCPLIF